MKGSRKFGSASECGNHVISFNSSTLIASRGTPSINGHPSVLYASKDKIIEQQTVEREMSGYPHAPPNYGYGSSQAYPYTSGQTPYGVPPPTSQGPPAPPYATPYAAPSAPYAPSHQGGKPPKDKPSPYGAPPPPTVPGAYGVGAPPPSAPSGYPTAAPPYGSPFASLLPPQFPPGTDPNVVACFQLADSDGSGLIDDKELQNALSSYNHTFSMRTVRLLMYNFTNANTRKIGKPSINQSLKP